MFDFLLETPLIVIDWSKGFLVFLFILMFLALFLMLMNKASSQIISRTHFLTSLTLTILFCLGLGGRHLYFKEAELFFGQWPNPYYDLDFAKWEPYTTFGVMDKLDQCSSANTVYLGEGLTMKKEALKDPEDCHRRQTRVSCSSDDTIKTCASKVSNSIQKIEDTDIMLGYERRAKEIKELHQKEQELLAVQSSSKSKKDSK